MPPLDLPFVWAGLIAFAVLAYVLLDGFDLGIGIVLPALPDVVARDTAVNSVAPVWDGNETWLVLGGGGLMAVFPLAYAIVLPALYAPLTAMLLALVLRGVAFEFRWLSAAHKPIWDAAFFIGSLVATLAHGIALGALLQGISVAGRAYAGGWFDWLTPFSLFTGLALTFGYALLGTTWLILKTTGDLQAACCRWARWLTVVVLVLIGIVSLWTPFLETAYYLRWFAWPTILFAGAMPVLTLVCAWRLLRALARGHELEPFLAASGLFVLCYIGLGISIFPYVVPPSVTIWQAAAPDSSLAFILVGTIVLMPLILGYTAYAYWTFRGKVEVGNGYH